MIVIKTPVGHPGSENDIMTEFRVVSVAELKPVLDVLNGLSWPVAFEEFPAIFERLGWEVQRKSGGSTSLAVSKRQVSVGKLGDELSEFWFRVSDTVAEVGAASKASLEEAFTRASQVVSECMGFAPTGIPWAVPGAVWDLPDGRQVRVLIGERSIDLMYWSKDLADNDRYARRRGIDPADDYTDRD